MAKSENVYTALKALAADFEYLLGLINIKANTYMIKNLFSLRVISLAVILSNLTFSGGKVTILPEATAQPDYTAHLRHRDLFCDGGTKIIGFPYGLFDWGEVPWGMPGDEFIRLFEKQIRQCTGDVWSGPLGIDTIKSDPIDRTLTDVNFEFEGENYTLSRIEIYNNSEIKNHLVERFGLPQNPGYYNAYALAGCIKDGIVCRRVWTPAGKTLNKGTWKIHDTWITLTGSGSLVLEPVEPILRTIERPYCTRFIVFKICD